MFHLICRNQNFSKQILLKINISPALKPINKTLFTNQQFKLFKSNKCFNKFQLTRLYGPTKASGERIVINKMSPSEIITKLFQFVWPKDNNAIKMRVVIAMGLLISAKLLNVAVPIFFKQIIDFLNKVNINDETLQNKVLYTAIALCIAYGAARAGSSLFGELRSAIFARVAQNSGFYLNFVYFYFVFI